MSSQLDHMKNINVSREDGSKSRKAYFALLLSICPGLGQQYSGHLIRGVTLYILLIIISWASAILFMYATSTYISMLLLLLPVLFYIIIGLDAVYCTLLQPDSYALKWYNGKWIYIAVFSVLFISINPLMDMLIGKHIVRAYFVDTDSMKPTVLKHDVIVIDKLSIPKRDDVVLIEMSNGDTIDSMSSVIDDQTLRRIIAVQGDEVEVRGRDVYVNNELIVNSSASYGEEVSPNIYTSDEYQLGPGVVPDNAYFVMSDAREYSFDSRMFGFIGKEHITGIAKKIFWSWNHDEGHFIWGRTAMSID